MLLNYIFRGERGCTEVKGETPIHFSQNLSPQIFGVTLFNPFSLPTVFLSIPFLLSLTREHNISVNKTRQIGEIFFTWQYNYLASVFSLIVD
jgi:hypothetical protein